LLIVVATTNPGKLREIRRALDGTPVTILSLQDFPPVREPEETGVTFAENARVKATYYAQHTGRNTVAEDSGLGIAAIGGRPGVESARYAGATYPEKFANLYRELAPHPRPWTARFVCSVALVKGTDGTVLFACEATVEGEIALQPRGAHGFGYDPIFFYPPYGRTLGDVTDEEKLTVSHRGKAFRELRKWIKQNLERRT
jgi:XTP/dITP diphosphohydrolase